MAELRQATDEEIFGAQPQPEPAPVLEGLRPATDEELFPGAPSLTTGEVAEKVATSVFGGFDIGVARFLGAPVDLGNFALSLFGVNHPEPLGGSRNFQRGLAFLHMAPKLDTEAPFPFISRVFEEVGAGVTALMPFMLAAKAGVATKGFAEPIFRMLREKPGSSLAAETGLASLAGGGAATARELFPGDPTAELWGQLAGGFVVPFLPQLSITFQFVNALRKRAVVFTKAGAQTEAAKRIVAQATDPEALARALKTRVGVPGERLTPAQIAEDPGLLALEEAVIRSSAEASGDFRDAVLATNRALRAELTEIGGDVPVERTQEFLKGRLDYLVNLLKARGATALAAARTRIAAARPRINRAEANRIAREEIESALRDSRAQETQLWEMLPRETAVSASAGRARVAEEIAKIGRTGDPDNVPTFVRRLFKGPDKKGNFPKTAFGESATLGEMVGVNSVRSRLLEEARIARSQKRFSKARALDNIADGVLEDVGALAKDPTELGQDIRLAMNFSKELNDRFTRGPVGKLLGMAREGGPRIAPELTLETTIGRPGPAGAVGARGLEEAVAPSLVKPEFQADPAILMEASQDFVRLSFFRQATNAEGRIIPTDARRFLKANEETLKQFPKVKAELEDLSQAQISADRIAATAEGRATTLLDKNRSRAALFLNQKPSGAIQAALKSRDPLGNMRQIVRQAAKDPTGDALAGLRTSFIEQMIARGQLKIEGNKVLVGSAMQEFFNANAGIIARSGLFTGSHIARLKQVINTAARVERSLTAGRRIEEIVESGSDMLLDLASRLVGAKLFVKGADRIGSSLVFASAGSRMVRRLTNAIPVKRVRDVITQAVLDPKLMQTLLTRVTLDNERALRARLRGFLVNLTDPREREGSEQRGVPVSERSLPNIARPSAQLRELVRQP